MRTPVRTPLAVLLAVAVSFLTACSSGAEPPAAPPAPATTSAEAYPVTVTADNGSVTLETRPSRIVSMSATATEMLFGMDAGGQVVAVDSTSTYPEQAPVTDLSAFTPSAEAVAGYTPDLVVISDDLNGLLDGLTRLGVPTLQLGAADTLQDAYDQMTTLGSATGHLEDARTMATTTQDRIDAAVASVPESAKGLSLYHELDPTYFSATSATFIGQLYERLGLVNIADAAPEPAGGYPQLSAEYVAGSAPDVVVLADTVCCAVTVPSFAGRALVGAVPAVAAGRVLAVDDAVASRWGPRTADLAEAVAGVLGR